MLLLEPAPTAFDLRWRMFGTSVRVHPMFWVLAAVLGWDYFSLFGFSYLLAWVLCVFVSILLHEFGHVWMGRLFGSHGHIVMYSFGGLAIGSKDLYARWQRIAVSLAGPGIQLLLWAALQWGFAPWVLPGLVSRLSPDGQLLAVVATWMMISINLYWPILNLLPIWPLDGGQVTREVCQALNARNGVAVSLGISLFTSGLLALDTLMGMKGKRLIPFDFIPRGGTWMLIFYLLFCVSSFQELQEENRRLRYEKSDDDWPWRE